MAVAVPQTDTKSTKTTWTIDPNHTLVEFGVKHMMVATVRGRFTGVTGQLIADEANSESSQFEAEIDAASIDTRNEQRDAHLRSADFLDVESFPTITFRSTRIEPISTERGRLIGDLTIRGVTREVTIDATMNGRGTTPFGQEIVGFTGETSIKRQDFGLTWNVALETGGVLVGDTVKIQLEVELVKQVQDLPTPNTIESESSALS